MPLKTPHCSFKDATFAITVWETLCVKPNHKKELLSGHTRCAILPCANSQKSRIFWQIDTKSSFRTRIGDMKGTCVLCAFHFCGLAQAYCCIANDRWALTMSQVSQAKQEPVLPHLCEFSKCFVFCLCGYNVSLLSPWEWWGWIKNKCWLLILIIFCCE